MPSTMLLCSVLAASLRLSAALRNGRMFYVPASSSSEEGKEIVSPPAPACPAAPDTRLAEVAATWNVSAEDASLAPHVHREDRSSPAKMAQADTSFAKDVEALAEAFKRDSSSAFLGSRLALASLILLEAEGRSSGHGQAPQEPTGLRQALQDLARAEPAGERSVLEMPMPHLLGAVADAALLEAKGFAKGLTTERSEGGKSWRSEAPGPSSNYVALFRFGNNLMLSASAVAASSAQTFHQKVAEFDRDAGPYLRYCSDHLQPRFEELRRGAFEDEGGGPRAAEVDAAAVSVTRCGLFLIEQLQQLAEARRGGNGQGSPTATWRSAAAQARVAQVLWVQESTERFMAELVSWELGLDAV